MKKDGFINITKSQQQQKYNIKVNYLEYFGCVQAIKIYFKSLKINTESNEMAINPISLAKIYHQVRGTKCYSDILIENGKSPNCCSKWEIKLGEGIDWKVCFNVTECIVYMFRAMTL